MPPLVRVVLISAKPTPLEDNRLMLLFNNEIDKDIIDADEHIKDIQKAVAEVTGKEVEIQTKLVSEGESIDDFPDLTKIIKNIPIEYVD